MGLVAGVKRTHCQTPKPPFPGTASRVEGTAHVRTRGAKELGKGPWIIRALQATYRAWPSFHW